MPLKVRDSSSKQKLRVAVNYLDSSRLKLRNNLFIWKISSKNLNEESQFIADTLMSLKSVIYLFFVSYDVTKCFQSVK